MSRNGRLFVPSGVDGYELADTVSQDGGYHLRLRGVQFARDNGRFFCALIDTETRQQMLSEPARVVVLGKLGEDEQVGEGKTIRGRGEEGENRKAKKGKEWGGGREGVAEETAGVRGLGIGWDIGVIDRVGRDQVS